MLEDLLRPGLDVQDVNAIEITLRADLIYAATLAICLGAMESRPWVWSYGDLQTMRQDLL